MRFVYLLLIAFVVFNCKTETKKADEIENQKSEEKLIVLATEEDFNAFFELFSTDSVFQLSRIKFPISYYTVDIEDNKEEYVFSKDDFKFVDFSEDRVAAKRRVDAYEPVIKKNGNSKLTYIRMGIDNGIRIEYYFEKDEHGEWYLVEIVNNSH